MEGELLIYTASILFWRDKQTMDYPYVMTSHTCSGLEAFVSRIDLELKQRPDFYQFNVSINALVSRLEPDGTLTPVDKTIVRHENAYPITTKFE